MFYDIDSTSLVQAMKRISGQAEAKKALGSIFIDTLNLIWRMTLSVLLFLGAISLVRWLFT